MHGSEVPPGPMPSSISSSVLAALVLAEAAFLALRTLASLGVVTAVWSCNLPAYLTPSAGAAAVGVPLLAGLALFALEARVAGAPGAGGPSRLRGSLWILALALPPLLCLSLPDRTGFLGDFLERRGSIEGARYAAMFPQSLFLDRWIQGRLLPLLATSLDLDRAARFLGATSYLALLAIAARGSAAFGLRGLWRVVAVTLLGVGGIACLFTGYSRDTVEFMPLELALCFALAARARRPARLTPWPELLLLALECLHRMAIVLIVPYLVVTLQALRASGGSWRRSPPWLLAALALVAGSLALAPRYLRVFATFDLTYHAGWLAARGGGIPFLDWSHDAGVLNALTILAPAAWLALLLLAGPLERSGRALDVALAAIWIPVVLLVRPQQGIFRDFDVYAPMALALSFVGVRQLARLDRIRPRLARSLGALSAISSVQGMLALMLVAASPAATDARVWAAIDDPATPAIHRAQMLDYLADGFSLAQDYRRAADLYARSVELAPTVRRLVSAGTSFADAGDYGRARGYFARLIAIDSTSVLGWCGYAATSLQLPDSAEARRSIERLRALTASPERRRVAVRFLDLDWRLDPHGTLRAALP